MRTANRTAPFDLIHRLQGCRLLTPEDLRKVEAYRRACPHHRAADLTDFLLRQRLLTRFQLDTIREQGPEALVLSKFILTDTLGKGGLGTVYRARAADGGAWYAVRIVPRRNVMSLEAVAEKVKALRDIRHPRVSALVHLGAAGDRVYLAWPFLEGGETLDALVRKQGRLQPRLAAQIGLQVASGLEPYHEHGLFHGLLKPSDVLIGADRRVRLLDFGVGFLLTSEHGKSLLDTMTNTQALASGVECSSPESIMDPLDRTPAGDQYSLGCILYYALAGRYPFPVANPVKKMLAHQCEEPRPLQELNPEVAPGLVAVIHRLMRKAPAERYGSIGEVIQAFQSLGRPRSNPVLSPAPRPAEVHLPQSEQEEEQPAAPNTLRSVVLMALALLGGGALLGSTLGWLLARH